MNAHNELFQHLWQLLGADCADTATSRVCNKQFSMHACKLHILYIALYELCRMLL